MTEHEEHETETHATTVNDHHHHHRVGEYVPAALKVTPQHLVMDILCLEHFLDTAISIYLDNLPTKKNTFSDALTQDSLARAFTYSTLCNSKQRY